MSVSPSVPAPLITTVIPTYRRPRLLRRAIASVLEQAGVPLQVCVYDNASGDETAATVAGLAVSEPRLCYYCHSANIGGAANFDYGLRQVKTPFFSILSDDDYLLPEFYKRALAGLAAHPEAMFWAGTVLNVDTDGMIWDARVDRWPRQGVLVPPDGAMLMTGGMAPNWVGIVFRREVLELEGLPDMETRGPSDLEYCLRLAVRFPFVLKKHPSAVWSLNKNSFSATQPLSSFWPGWQRMMAKFETNQALDVDFRRELVAALRRDAQSMLLRRGANGIAAGRLEFARDAADVLEVECGLAGRANFLRSITWACAHATLAQAAYTTAYRLVERRSVSSRSALQSKFGHLLRDH